MEIPAPWRRGPVQAVVVSTHREGCNVDEPTTQEVGKLPLEWAQRPAPEDTLEGLYGSLCRSPRGSSTNHTTRQPVPWLIGSKDIASKDIASKDIAAKDIASKDIASKYMVPRGHST